MMSGKTKYFLLVYSFDKAALIRQMEFSDREAATKAYAEAEAEYGSCDRYETVLLGAEDLQTVKKTHGQYFRPSDQSLFSDFLPGNLLARA